MRKVNSYVMRNVCMLTARLMSSVNGYNYRTLVLAPLLPPPLSRQTVRSMAVEIKSTNKDFVKLRVGVNPSDWTDKFCR